MRNIIEIIGMIIMGGTGLLLYCLCVISGRYSDDGDYRNREKE